MTTFEMLLSFLFLLEKHMSNGLWFSLTSDMLIRRGEAIEYLRPELYLCWIRYGRWLKCFFFVVVCLSFLTLVAE